MCLFGELAPPTICRTLTDMHAKNHIRPLRNERVNWKQTFQGFTIIAYILRLFKLTLATSSLYISF